MWSSPVRPRSESPGSDEFQVFFPGDEARFFPEFPDGALQEVFTGFDLTAEAVPFADAEAAFFAA